MKFLFCNKCHKRIVLPKFIFSQNVSVGNVVTIKCSDPKCSGQIKYKPLTKT